MRTNLSCCLGLIDNGQYKSTNRLLVVVPHERPHGIMRILKNLCMLLPKAQKMWAIKDTMALVADSIGGTKCAPPVVIELYWTNWTNVYVISIAMTVLHDNSRLLRD